MLQSSENPLLKLAGCGQSVWLDSLRRSFIRNGEMKRLIDEDGLSGMTSNPSIFEKAIGGSSDYDAQIQQLLAERDWDIKELYERLAVQDIQDAADLLRPVYDRTQGLDGFVSLEVSPYLALDTAGTITEARRLWKAVSRQNVMIKVPATKEGVPAIQQLISEGLNINITLLFSQERYEEVAEAYLSGLEIYAKSGSGAKRDLRHLASVASFFVSRIDTLADTLIEDQIRSRSDESRKARLTGLKGKIAIANAKMAYQRYLRIFNSDRWHKLATLGARPQRVLWASTSTKNPDYRDVLYVEELIGPETVTTVPPSTFAAFREHGKVRETLTEDIDEARSQLAELEQFQISLAEITEMLTSQAIDLFSDPFDKLLGTLEKKRRNLLGDRMDFFSYELPSELNLAVGERLQQWSREGKVRRLWRKDASLWTGKDEGRWLGWLEAPQKERERVSEILDFAREVRDEGFRDVLLLGMGGSSLAPALFASTFSEEATPEQKEAWPRLQVVDSTDPAQIRRIEDSVDLERTLIIVSSKSGSTLEPNILYRYFRSRIEALNPGANAQELGRRFVAITDPGSSLEALARQKSFRKIFHGDPEIGGRYCALSDFGIVPAAVMGVDIRELLDRGCLMVNSCYKWSPPRENPGVHLGIVLGVLANHGRNKITFVSSPEIRSLELWLEQLLAESTGKQGKGLIPVSHEELSSVEAYGADRIFVYLKLENSRDTECDRSVEENLIQLQASGQPVIRIVIRDRINLGQEFFRWEMATAVTGSLIGIDPFDQPDVEASKLETRALTAEYERSGILPLENAVVQTQPPVDLRLFVDPKVQKRLGSHSRIQDYLKALFGLFQQGDYFALLAYLPMTGEIQAGLDELRLLVRNHMRVATCLQFGPRFLHSTGQAFKGGPNQGVFLELSAEEDIDLAVPQKRYSFGTVIHAQALGDLKVLIERDRRVIHVHMGRDIAAGIRELHSLIRHALHGIAPLNNQVNTEGINKEWAMNRERKVGGTT